MKSNAVTYVLSGGVFAAILGPTGAKVSAHLVHTDYTGSFIVMAILGIANWAVLSCVKFPVHIQKQEVYLERGDGPSVSIVRPLGQIIEQPLFKLSCSIATIAHTVMVMIMSNCAISMSDDFSLGTASTVLEVHFLAMFLPGFFTGSLIKSYGAFNVAVVGAIVFALSAVMFAVEDSLWNYYTGMTLLGLAWNFSYSAATIMLMGCYTVSLFTPALLPYLNIFQIC